MALPRVVIIGGGGIGSATAYFLSKHVASHFAKVVCIERDHSLARSSTALSAGGCRQQFSIPENTRLSMFGAKFLRSAAEHLTVSGDEPADVSWRERGYLLLASQAGEESMRKNYLSQMKSGAAVGLMRPPKLAGRFPWLSTEGISLGCYGHRNEGYFDPFSLTQCLTRKARSLGAEWIDGSVFALDSASDGTISTIHYKPSNGKESKIDCDIVINAGGAWAADIFAMAKRGNCDLDLPVRPRKRDVFVFHCPDAKTWRAPLTADPSGVYFRSDGDSGNFLAGASPPSETDHDVTREQWQSGLEPNHSWFEDHIWPALAARVPAFENIKLKSAWSGLYDYNCVDQNAIVGLHPKVSNMVLCNGLSGHGIQHAVGLGRALSELLVHGSYQTIDLSRFSPARLLRPDPQPLKERSVL